MEPSLSVGYQVDAWGQVSVWVIRFMHEAVSVWVIRFMHEAVSVWVIRFMHEAVSVWVIRFMQEAESQCGLSGSYMEPSLSVGCQVHAMGQRLIVGYQVHA